MPATVMLVQMYQGLTRRYRLTPDAAAILKYASNAYHALKTSFANEIGTLCRQLDIDSHQVMDVFIRIVRSTYRLLI
jgi:GDP-mannose 6-dehydrogenase